MKPLRVYLDTSVIGGLFDEEFAADTLALLEAIRAGEITPVISDEIKAEAQRAPVEVKELLEELAAFAEVAPSSPEAAGLALAYVAAGVVTAKYKVDALHVALATVAEVDVLVSWNFKHMVNLSRIQGYNGVNLIRGYGMLEIRSPKEVLFSGS